MAIFKNMETVCDFGIGLDLIAGLATRHGMEAPPFKRLCSREQDREINGVIDVLATRNPSDALQTIENAAGSEIGATIAD